MSIYQDVLSATEAVHSGKVLAFSFSLSLLYLAVPDKFDSWGQNRHMFVYHV
jgi:hypothetical protein